MLTLPLTYFCDLWWEGNESVRSLYGRNGDKTLRTTELHYDIQVT